jgi:hypothetical protein
MLGALWSLALGVSPEPGATEFLKKYKLALNYAVNKILIGSKDQQ